VCSNGQPQEAVAAQQHAGDHHRGVPSAAATKRIPTLAVVVGAKRQKQRDDDRCDDR